MNSHTLADLLKARRTNDIRFEVEVALEGHDDGDIHRTELHDDRVRETERRDVALEEVLTYDSENDFLVLRLGSIFLGDPDAKAPPVLTTEEWATVRRALLDAANYGRSKLHVKEAFLNLRNKIDQAI